jgi:hypothetical protein
VVGQYQLLWLAGLELARIGGLQAELLHFLKAASCALILTVWMLMAEMQVNQGICNRPVQLPLSVT